MFESPKYVAVTLVAPTASVDVMKFAFPPMRCAVPSSVFPAAKVTGPVGSMVGEVIVAMKGTAWPDADGFGDEMRVAEVVACGITWFTTVDVLPGLLASPAFTACSG